MIALAVPGCSSEAEEARFPYFDEQGGRVRDMAGLLDEATEADLANKLDHAEAAYGPQMGVVTVTSLEGYDISDFSLQYARAWRLGDAQRNDGILLLVAPNERQARIEIGKGIEATFTDVYCREVLEDAILPHFRAGDMQAGIVAGTSELILHMRKHPTIPANDNLPPAIEEAA